MFAASCLVNTALLGRKIASEAETASGRNRFFESIQREQGRPVHFPLRVVIGISTCSLPGNEGGRRRRFGSECKCLRACGMEFGGDSKHGL